MSKPGDKHWTVEQIAQLKQGYESGAPTWMLAAAIGKSEDAMRTKARRLEIKRPIEELPKGQKRCPHCQKVKSIDTGFYSNQSWCRECLAESRQDWGKRNKKHLRQYHHIRVARAPKRMKATAARGSHKQRAIIKEGHNLTAEQWDQIIQEYNGICPLCNQPFTEQDPPVRDCITPVCKGGLLTVDNVQPVHAFCNGSKGAQ